MAQRGSALPRGRGKEGWRDARAVRRVAPLAQHGTARAAPASRGASQRHKLGDRARAARRNPPHPLAPASPPFAVSTCGVAVSACGVAISARGVLTFRNAPHPRAPATRGRARGRRLDYGNECASIRIDPRPSPVGACTAVRVESSNARANASPPRSIDTGSGKKKNAARAATRRRRGPRDLRNGSKRSPKRFAFVFRETAPAAAGSESRSATGCASVRFKSKASVSYIQRAASQKTQENLDGTGPSWIGLDLT